VNTAARVQAAAEPGSVLADAATQRLAGSAIGFADAGVHTLKGKAEPQRLWRAVRVLSAVGGSQRVDGLEAPLAGRDAELRTIKALFHATAERRVPRLVLICGPAGVGKSRLGWEFEKYADGLKAAVSGQDEQTVRAAVADLVRREVLSVSADPRSPERGSYGFAQQMLRQVAYETLSRRDRKARHLKVAAYLRGAFPNDGEEVADVIAHHYLDALHAISDEPDVGEIRGLASTALIQAAERAERTGALDRAAASYATAAELSPHGVDPADLAGCSLVGAMAPAGSTTFPACGMVRARASSRVPRWGPLAAGAGPSALGTSQPPGSR
jgi:AAA ATPase domain